MISNEFMDVKIRKAKKGDLKEIARIYKEVLNKRPYNEKWDDKSSLKRIREFFKGNRCKVFVAVLESKVIGFTLFSFYYWWSGERIDLNMIAVDKELQSKGVGKLLMKHLNDYGKKHNIDAIDLMINKKTGVERFYKKKGFKKTKYVMMHKKIK